VVNSVYSNATQEQIGLLQTTAVPLRSLTFAPCDPASCVVLQQLVRVPEAGPTVSASFAA